MVARANDSLSRRQRWQVFGALAAASLALAPAFAAAGAWPVLPYSLLEIGVLACAFAWCDRHAEDWERLVIAGDTRGRRAERGRENGSGASSTGTGCASKWSEAGERSAGAPRVLLRGGGAAWEFGHALPAAERLAVARELRRLTGLRC